MASDDEADSTSRRSVLKAMAAAGVLPAAAGEVEAKPSSKRSQQASRLQDVVPAPVEAKALPTDYTLTSNSTIAIRSDEAREVAEYLADLLRPSTGHELPVVEGPPRGRAGGISLRLAGAPDDVGDEGYRLNVTPHAVRIRANDPAGLFNGVQTLRQLLPAKVESKSEQSGPWTVPGGHILDYPRFKYRGAMLDVAREFYPVEQVKTFIDEIALYKINYFHLHLSEDSGWRIQIDSWPKLTSIGGHTDYDGGKGGYYTKDEYKEIVNYAQARNITVVPEIDMPAHTGAALASYPELNCDGTVPQLPVEGTTSLCINKDITYEFIDDVIRELAAMTPGPYIHLGGDEAHNTSNKEYNKFFDRVSPIVQKYDKEAIGWHPILNANPPDTTIGQYWDPNHQAPEVEAAAQQGNELILSPYNHAYVDGDYPGNPNPDLGLSYVQKSVKKSYNWNPGSYIQGVDESSVLGPEAPVWGETIETLNDVEFLNFPRFPAIAELGWSPWSTHDWQEFKSRLAAQGPRWDMLNINYYRSPQIPWPPQKAIVVGDISTNEVLFSGITSEVDLTVANRSKQAASITATLEAPEGWKTSTSEKRVEAKNSTTITIEVIPPSSAVGTDTILSSTVEAPSNYQILGSVSQTVSVQSSTLTPDKSENDYTGLVRGNPDIVNTDTGKGLLLDGEDDYVDVNGLQEAPKLDFTEPGFTIEARIKPSEITSPVPIVAGGDAPDPQYALKIRKPERGVQPEFWIYKNNYQVVTAPPPADLEGNWHTVAGVCTGSELRLYINGELVDKTSHSVTTLNDSSAPIHVGHSASAGYFAEATFDKVHVYDRALSKAELQATHTDPTKDTVLWYDLNSFDTR